MIKTTVPSVQAHRRSGMQKVLINASLACRSDPKLTPNSVISRLTHPTLG
jgi:hypothetical protein